MMAICNSLVALGLITAVAVTDGHGDPRLFPINPALGVPGKRVLPQCADPVLLVTVLLGWVASLSVPLRASDLPCLAFPARVQGSRTAFASTPTAI